MGEIKQSLKMIDYLKEKGISYEDLKTMIEEQIESALKEKEGETKEADMANQSAEDAEAEQEEVPTFTKADIKEMIQTEVMESLKIKRKVPSKGKILKPEEINTEKESIKKNWFEVIV